MLLPPHGGARLPDSTVEGIRCLCGVHTGQAVAVILTQDGILTPHGQPYTAQRVAKTRCRKTLSKRLPQPQ